MGMYGFSYETLKMDAKAHVIIYKLFVFPITIHTYGITFTNQ